MRAAPRLAHCAQSKFCKHDKFLPPRQSLPRHCAVLPSQVCKSMTISLPSYNLYHDTRLAQLTPTMKAKTHAILSLRRDSYSANMTMTCQALRRVTLPNHAAGPLAVIISALLRPTSRQFRFI